MSTASTQPQGISPEPSGWARARTWFRDSLVAGIIAVIPLVVVWWVFDKVVLSMDGVLALLPESWRDVTWTPPWMSLPVPLLKTPGLGFLLSIMLLVLVGWIARGIFGRRIVTWVTRLLANTPILGTVYTAVRQLLETVFSSQAQNFQRVVLVEFPRKGVHVLGFVTAAAWAGAEQASGKRMLSVFVPTTPNPTSGFFVMFPEDEIQVMNMTVEEAFKAIMSSGIVTPEDGGLLEVDPRQMTVEVPPVTADGTQL